MSHTTLTPLEQYVIDKVREKRLEKGMTIRELADAMEVSYGFIGDVESPKRRAKYRLEHINRLAEIFDCSPQDFLPKTPL